jgi:aldose sugar dehydrogenase
MIKIVYLSLIIVSSFLFGCDNVGYAYHKLVRTIDSQAPELIAPIVVKTEQADIEVTTLLTDFYLPWSITALPGSALLVTEKQGVLYRYNLKTKERVRISGLPKTKIWGQGGLMDVVVHPDFVNNRWLYFSYVGLVKGKLAATRVARGKLVGDHLEGVEVIFTAEPAVKSGGHFGSALVFDDAGYLFITSGERRSRPKVQDLSTHLGKVIRLHDDGTVPDDNPFVQVPGARPEIYTYGHRNPQGVAIEPNSGAVWSVEHGPRGGDEVNVLRAGANYGWPVISLGKEYASGKQVGEGTSKPGMESPHYYYVPSIATSGMTFYTGEAFPNWRGNLFIGALSLTHINRLEISDGKVTHEERILNSFNKRIRDVEQGTDGFLYVLTDDGQLLQLKPIDDSGR